MVVQTQELAAPEVRNGGFGYRAVARRTLLRIGRPGAGFEAGYLRPHRVEVSSQDGSSRTVAVPDREFQIRLALFGVTALALLARRRRSSR